MRTDRLINFLTTLQVSLQRTEHGDQPITSLHSQYDFGDVSRSEKIDGSEAILMHPNDANGSGITEGDVAPRMWRYDASYSLLDEFQIRVLIEGELCRLCADSLCRCQAVLVAQQV